MSRKNLNVTNARKRGDDWHVIMADDADSGADQVMAETFGGTFMATIRSTRRRKRRRAGSRFQRRMWSIRARLATTRTWIVLGMPTT